MIRTASRAAAVSFALMLTSGAALAQQPAPQAAQAPAPNVAAGRELAILSGLTRSFDAILPRFGEQMKQQAVSRPEMTKDLNEVLDQLKPELELQKQQMITTAGRIFAARMSEQELKDVAAFLKTPSGQKYVQVQPLVLDELVTEMQAWTQNVAEYVMVRVRSEMGKRGHQMQ